MILTSSLFGNEDYVPINYNIYMSGPSGTGKTTYAKASTERLAATEEVPLDWCYVYNFQNPRSLDGVPNVRTCVTPLLAGMKVETQRDKGRVPMDAC